MTKHITITHLDAIWVVTADGAVLAESRRALELREGGYPPAIYIPREDIAMALFQPSPTRTTGPYKGQASYFTFVGEGSRVKDAAWSYE